MLNTQKLLYILPDLAYVAELLPAKKPHSFTIQSFRQINGEFIDDNEFIAENIAKLFSKLNAEEYHIILPDFLFTNTIVSVEEKNDTKIKEYLKESLLPSLDLKPTSHLLEPFILTEFKGTSKVQLSALEKSLIVPLRINADAVGVKIAAISPLSWTLKSLISLEPSISVTQVGEYLYTAQHYIGIDMTIHTTIQNIETISETVKTLKGAEPSIQTVYLLSNTVVEEKMKALLSDTLPLQQLVTASDDDAQMPSYVQQMIENGMQTLSISEYPVPKFKPDMVTADEKKSYGATVAGSSKATDASLDINVIGEPESIDESDFNETEGDENNGKDAQEELEEALPKPVAPPVAQVSALSLDDIFDTQNEEDSVDKIEEEVVIESHEETIEIVDEAPVNGSVDTTEDQAENQSQNEDAIETGKNTSTHASMETESEEIDLTQFIPGQSKVSSTTRANKRIIKNKSGVTTMLKMVFITLAVFFATVAVGVGVGLGLLSLTSKDTPESTPIVEEATPTPVASSAPSPSPSPTPELKVADLSILVVNATTKAGYAGQFADKLETAEFGTVDVGNAKGEYEEGYYVLMTEENDKLEELLEKTLDLDLTYSDEISTEDAKETYDAVIVLAE